MEERKRDGMTFAKKLTTGVLAATLALSLAGCSGGESAGENSNIGEGTSAVQESEAAKEGAVKVEDIDWRAEQSVVDGERVVAFTYTNNSKYPIFKVEIEFAQKGDATSEQIISAFEESLKDDYTDEDVKKLSMSAASSERIVAPGETLSGGELMDSTYRDIDNLEQCNLMEPDMMTVDYIGDDGKLYEEYYDFKSGSYSLSSLSGKPAVSWSDGELASMLPKAEFDIVTVTVDSDYFYFRAAGVERSEYDAYVAACKGKGFTESEESASTWFYASNAEGYRVSLSFSDENETMSGNIEMSEE